MESPLAKGFFFEKPGEKTPEWIKGKISIKVEDAIALLNEHKNERGYVNLDVKKSKEGKVYLTVNTWKPTQDIKSIDPDEEPAPF